MKYFISVLALLIIILVFGEAGYYFIEYVHQDIAWDKTIQGKYDTFYVASGNQFYIGLDKGRLNKFDRSLANNTKVREVVQFNDSSNYYSLLSKQINMRLLIRERSDSTNKYSIHIAGSISGLCSASGAKERLMLMLRQIEYDRMPNVK